MLYMYIMTWTHYWITEYRIFYLPHELMNTDQPPLDILNIYFPNTGHFHLYQLWLIFVLSKCTVQFYSLICSSQFHFSRQDAFLLSLSVSGNYYGTPRPVHISAESPPSPTRNTATCSETSAHAANRSATWRRLQRTVRTARTTQACQASTVKPGLYGSMCWQDHKCKSEKKNNRL